MSTSHRGALALYVATAVAGIALGIALDRTVLRGGRSERPDPRAMRTHLYDELQLTADQRVRMDSIFDQRAAAFRALMTPLRPAQDSIVAAARVRMREVLTDAQRPKFEQMVREREQRERRPAPESR